MNNTAVERANMMRNLPKEDVSPDEWMGDESVEHFENMKNQGYPKGGSFKGPFIGEDDEA